jgi:general secretion pathway protein F
MPLFRYQAVDAAGEVIKEEMEAKDQDVVVGRLQDQGLLPLSIEETTPGSLSHGLRQPLFNRRQRISQSDIALITRQLANLLRAGLPLDRALTILIGIADEGPVKILLTRIQDQVRGGASLADALEAQSRVFSRLYLNMIRAGEAGSSLDVVMLRLTEFMDRSKALRDTITSALIYPIILLIAAGMTVLILLTWVVPQFEQLFADAGQSLPLATQIVITVGEGVRSYWWVGMLILAGGLLYLRQQLDRPESRYRLHGLMLRIPLLKDLIAKVEMARFSRTLGTLLKNGVSLLNALLIVKETMTNQVMATALSTVGEQLKGGQGLAEPLMEAGVFPRLAVHMIRVGEETGQLQDMLLQVADTYDHEVQSAIQRLLALLEPVLILGLGVIIAAIIMSILVAIFSLNELAF